MSLSPAHTPTSARAPRRRPKPRLDPLGLNRAGLGGLEGLLIVATVFLAPMNHLRLDIAYVTASDAMAFSALIVMLANNRIPIRFFGPATVIWFISFLAFAWGLTLSSLVRGDPTELPIVLMQYSFSLIILPMLIAGRSYEQIVVLIKVLVLSLIVVMLVGVYVVYFAENPSKNLISGNGRLRSLIERENECAVHGAIAIFFLMGLYKMGEAKLSFVVIGVPILLYGIMLTGSVTGLLVTSTGVMILIFLFGPLSQILISVGALALGVALLLTVGDAILPDIFVDRVLSPVLARDLENAGNFSDRQLLLAEALQMARGTLLVGVGVNQFHILSVYGAHVHNAYITALVEGGMIAMLGLMGLFFTGVYLVWAVFSAEPKKKVWAVTLTILLVYIVTFNTFPTFYARFWNVPLILAYAFCASRLHNPTKYGRRSSAVSQSPRRVPT